MSKPQLSKVKRSIRTHFGILTSSILLTLLLVFYLGGRYILVNIIRQAEREITNVSNDIKKIIAGQATSLQEEAVLAAEGCAKLNEGSGYSDYIKTTLSRAGGRQVNIAAVLNLDGSLKEGYYTDENRELNKVIPEMLVRYFNSNSNLESLFSKREGPITGVISFLDTPHYITIVPIRSSEGTFDSFFCLGATVHGNKLLKKMTDVSHGLSVFMNDKRLKEGAQEDIKTKPNELPAPIFEEDKLFAAGSQWHVGSNEFEAVIPIYDILGKEISSLSIRFPRSFASLTTIALGWLTGFVAVVGIIFIAPVFWLQSRIILDPLSRLEKQIQEIGGKYKENQIEYLNYTSNDEFGRFAHSVDNLLRELNSKSAQVSINAQRQKALISGMPDCLCIFNKSLNLVSVEKHPDNAPPIPGLEVNKILSADSFKDESIVLFERALAEALDTGKIRNISLICRGSNNRLRYFETRITRMNETTALVVFRDVTQDLFKRQKQEKIEAREGKAKQMSTLGNLAAGIAHDFNNVFTIIKNTMEVQFCDEGKYGQREEEAVGAIKEAASRGSTLVQELMTYAGQGSTTMKKEHPANIIKVLTPLYKGVVQPSVNLEISHGENLHDVMVDSDQFWKVIVNLVKNAAESIKSSHGYIKISTYNYELTQANAIKFFSSHTLEPDQGVIFEVADNGGGIPQENIDRLFEPFFSTKAIGRGLGLATVFGIVDSHNGGIGIISHENIGTKFRVWLPAAGNEVLVDEVEELAEDLEEELHTSAPATVTAATLPETSKPCVLIIDDDPSIIKTTALLLSRMGIQTLTAESRTEAAARFRKYKSRVDLVMMDAQIGNLDSVRLLSTLRMSSENLPVIICSGHSKEKIEKMFVNSHIDGVLIKPYTMGELREMLTKFVVLDK